MGRTTKDKRTIVKDGADATRARLARTTTYSIVRFGYRRAWTTPACWLAFGVFGLSGCSVFGGPTAADLARNRGEYVMQDDSATSAWSTAASEPNREGEVRYSALKPIDTYSTSSGYGQSESAEPSFADKVKGFFSFSSSSKAPATNSNGAYDHSSPVQRDDVSQYSQTKPRLNSNARETYATSNVSQENQSEPSFWSKMFPARQSTQQPEPELRPNYVPTQTSRSVAQPKATAKPSSSLIGRLVPTRRSQNLKNSVVDKYDETRFLPSYKEIEKYYYPSGAVYVTQVAVNRQTDVVPNAGVPYGSSAYPNAPIARPNSASPVGSTSAVGTRVDSSRGSVSMTPIVRDTANAREGSAEGRSLGVTRSLAQNVTKENVAQTSYAERKLASTQRHISPKALYGWNPENNAVLDAVKVAPSAASITNGASEDSGLVSSLGRKPDYSWFNSTTKSAESESSTSLQKEVYASELEDDGLDSQLDAAYSPSVNDSESLQVEEAYATEESSSTNVVENGIEPGASLDDIFDAVSSNGGDVGDSVSNDEANDDNNEDFSDFPSSDMVVESVDTLAAADSDDSAEIVNATPLADAIAQYAVPLEESEKSDDPVVEEDELLKQATEATTTATLPDSIDDRKVESKPAPLTNEEIAWVTQIKSAIQTLLVERKRLIDRGVDARSCDARLRLLYLVIGEYDRSIQDIQDESDPLKIFWEKECRGLETLLQNQLEEIDPSFVAERLRSGLDSLSGLCNVKIRKAALVKAPACYGLYEERLGGYKQGEIVYAYTELDFLTSKETEKGFAIDVECRWRLVDASGRQVIPFESQRCSNVSETKLRDVVLNVSVPLPENMDVGTYTLELEVVDMNAAEPVGSVKRLQVQVKTESDGSI